MPTGFTINVLANTVFFGGFLGSLKPFVLFRYAEGSYRIWVFRASEDDGEREFGRLVHTSELDSWEALKGFTCLRGPRGEVYSVVATTGGAGLAVMRLNMDTFE